MTNQLGQDPDQFPQVPPQAPPQVPQMPAPQYTPQPAPQVPPQYGQPQVAPGAVPPYPPYVQQNPSGAPYTTPPPAPKRRVGLLIGAIAGGVVLVAGISVGTVVLLNQNDAQDATPAATATPSPSPKPSPSATPEEQPKAESSDSDRPVYGPNDPEIPGTGEIGERLEAFKEELKASNDDGSLWEKIPRTKENTGAYVATQVILTDLRSAARFGVTPEDAIYFAKHAKHLELQLLAQKPLGDSVHYTMSDGTIFDYNGETGAVEVTHPES